MRTGCGVSRSVFADDLGEGVAELLEAHHGFLAGLFARVGKDFKRAGSVAQPMVCRQKRGGEAKGRGGPRTA